MPDSRFTYAPDALRGMVADALSLARDRGATEAEAEVSEGYGQSVTVYLGKQHGYASTSDLAPKAIQDTVSAALSIARFTAADPASGLAESELIARSSRDLDLFHPWDLRVERAIEMAKACEAAAFRLDKRIVNSEGATVSCQQSQFIAGNTAGFLDGYRSSRHYVSCAVIAAEGDAMQRDDWYSSQRSAADLARPEAIGDYAGRRALARLRSRRLGTREARVLFEAPVAGGLVQHFVAAVSGGSLYRKSSFLLDSLGTQVFSPIVSIREDPHLPRGHASSWFDDDGVVTRPREVVKDGVLQGYFLGVYSARKLGLRTTGNAGGNHNLILAPGRRDFAGMLKELGTGLLVTELMGQGANMVTGDYSRGASGYWVEGGAIRFPVEEITIAGNLREMFRNVSAVGGDVLVRGSRISGSIVVDGMTIAGD